MINHAAAPDTAPDAMSMSFLILLSKTGSSILSAPRIHTSRNEYMQIAGALIGIAPESRDHLLPSTALQLLP